MMNNGPLGPFGTPTDVAQAALFLASPAADYVAGEVLSVNGAAFAGRVFCRSAHRVKFPGAEQVLANFSKTTPQLRGQVMLPVCGHWTQQERATEVNAAIAEFLRSLGINSLLDHASSRRHRRRESRRGGAAGSFR